MRNIIRRVAHLVLPKQVKPRKIPLGLAKGKMAKVDFRYDTAFFFGRHEPDLHPHYKGLLKAGMKCFDVGTYRGWDALQFAHLTGGEVVSFDGNPKCVEMAADFLSPSGVSVQLVRAFLNDGTDGGATLDKAASDHFTPDFIKIDVEGAEVLVLGGARQILADRRPSLVLEVHSAALETECEALLKGCGYHPVVVKRSAGPWSEARGLEHNRWIVCEGRGHA